ncbi:MAG: phosphotransferase, partial [Phycisphaerales bacterium]|nr:phosphotransferase [Phycisphaerales bacterium]
MDDVARALAAAGRPAADRMTTLGGGCIHRVCAVTLDGGERVVAKCASANEHPMLREEQLGLERLAMTGCVRVPAVLGPPPTAETPVLLLEFLPAAPATAAAWSRLGSDLARLHATPAGARYGFEADNHLGRTPQKNDWHDDWIAFNRHCRLGPQIDRAADAGRLEPREHDRLRRLLDRLDSLLPPEPTPALLHGDLWSGNALVTRDDDDGVRVAVIDPACSVGDGWADIAMMRLFGGFPASCLAAHADAIGEPEPATRIAVYQLY